MPAGYDFWLLGQMNPPVISHQVNPFFSEEERRALRAVRRDTGTFQTDSKEVFNMMSALISQLSPGFTAEVQLAQTVPLRHDYPLYPEDIE